MQLEPHYRIDRWDTGRNKIERCHAIAESLPAGRGAFNACVSEWPDKTFTLRNGARVLLEHPPFKRDER
jgi:hypothetical protein